MLQPRVCVKMEFTRMCFGALVCAAFFTLVVCQDINNEELIESSRIKREGVPENRDLTVLLVNQKNDYNTRIGRYHSVKPLIGLLTSTARTFIQDGVTTEFATQILGTTLDNGRIYAQLLTKSSLVLYNKPSNVEDTVVVQPTRVHSAFDGQWNVKQDIGFIDPEKFILKNTDYLAPNSKVETVYASKPIQENVKTWNSPSQTQVENPVFDEPIGRRVQPVKEIPRFIQNEAFNYLDGPTIENEKKLEYFVEPSLLQNINTLHRQSKSFESVTEPIKEIENKDIPDEPSIVKVKPNYELPTFTIKNEFSPIFYYIDNVESKRPQPQAQQTKAPKKLFGQKSEPRPKKTFTYEGFADFTTLVGDTVIIFTPNTELSRQPNPDEVNVFPSAQRADKLGTKITFLSADIPVATSTYKAHEVSTATKITKSTSSSSSEENRNQKALFNDEDSLKKVLYEVDDKVPDAIGVQYNSGFDLNIDVIQPSEAAVSTTESTRVTDDLGVLPIQEYNSVATEPLVLLSPSSTVYDIVTESAVTENDMIDLLTHSEEEIENTAAEVTEKMEEEEEDEDETTPEMELDVVTTTESGHSEESLEDFETTTESKYDVAEIDPDEQEEVLCTNGLETQSTMTTAYKTLTYLTTYFIPLESTETTTSIKSDVVIESNIGYFTNVVCKTNLEIEPTAVLNESPSVTSNLEAPEIAQKESTTKAPVVETSTQTTETDREERPEEEESEQENTENDATEQYYEEREARTSSTERTTTRQSHVEVSASTESTTTTTENSVPEEDKSEDTENEIDVIYKTLYTTYTYFTTFFGDSTSSVQSHKSVVTNILTSTIDLSKLDPSLLGAFNEDEIAPTNVGIGRPTATYVNSIVDLVKNKDVIESVEIDETYSSQTPTPSLGDIASINPDAVKTYFTTYTFFTTIYVGDDANVCSRSEVYTNYVGPDELIPTKANPLGTESTKAQFDFRNCRQVKKEPPTNDEEESTSMVTSVSTEHSSEQAIKVLNQEEPKPTPIEVDMLFSVESNPLESENSYVTDVKSSSSKGERQYLENNNILDDQISSESNIEEILPSPTLLLQTSYTTFTYFTTMYIGKDSSKVKSHLETITNVVTETIMPNKEPEDESNLPITYYTTFTYWTTLYKDKSTTITSREEIVSNVVTPSVQSIPTINPIDTRPIDIDSVLPPKDLEVEIKPSLIDDSLEQDDGKATFYTTYTYFTTFYAGNTSQIRSSLETVTNVVDNTKIVEDNQIARKVPSGSPDKNLIQDNGEKPLITPTVVKEEIKPTSLPDLSSTSPTVLLGTYIDNLYAEVKPVDTTTESEKKILFSQVAVISGDSTVVTSDNKTLNTDTTSSTKTTTEDSSIRPTPEVIESTVADNESTTESQDDDEINRKKSRLTFTPRRPSVTPVIIPFSSRNRPTFVPKRILNSSATTITRQDATPTITATPTLKSVRTSGYSGNRKPSSGILGSSSAGKRFSGRSSISNLSANVPSASRAGNLGRASIQPTSRRTGFRSSSLRSNSLDYASRSAIPRIRPTASSRLPVGRSSIRSSAVYPTQEQNEFSETSATQQEENATEPLDEVTEAPAKTTNNPLLRFRRPLVPRQPGTAITPRSTTPPTRRTATPRGRVTTTTRKSTTRTTPNPLLSLRRQRPNALFPRRNLFRQPEPEPEEVNEQNQEGDELLDEEEDFEEDNDYDSSDRKERQVSTPSTIAPKRSNIVQIRPFGFRRRTKRQVDYGNRKYSNFRRPALKSGTTRKPDPEPETEAPVTPRQRPGGRYNPRTTNARTTTAAAPRSSSRQSFIVRGESRTTTGTPAYRRAKTNSRPSSRTTTTASRPKAPRLTNRSNARSSTSRNARTRTTTSRASSRQRGSFESHSGERYNNYNNVLNDGKITITHQIPTEVTIPFFNGKVTEYKNVLSATPKVETLLLNQVSTSHGPLGNAQLVLAAESTEVAENGATKLIKYLLHETPTTTVIFTPTTIRGRKTSFSHILPSTVYNVEPVTQTIAPEINANVPLANLLLSQLLLGNQQPAINPLLALQGQGLIPQQPLVQTPVTEYKTRTTTYVTTVTDARETVLPITFKGKAILTTIVDPTTNVITATEFITDTIVNTPTALAPPPQFNSLLLPLLLQQQQQQQQPQALLQTANPLLGLGLQPELGLNNLNPVQNNLNNDIYSNSPKPNILSDFNSNEDFSEDDNNETEDDAPPPPPSRSRSRVRAPKPAPPVPPKLTSVVTLYVSGRHPGEFSTVLSTVVTDDTQTVRKREAIYYEDIQVSPSILPTIDELFSSQIDNNVISNTEKFMDSSSVENQIETQSLESIVGEINRHIKYDASPTYVVKLAKPSVISHIEQSAVDDVSDDTLTSLTDDDDKDLTNHDDDETDVTLTTLVTWSSLDGSNPSLRPKHPNAFNTNAIVYDNTPWQPGRDIDPEKLTEDERKLKNLATRVMSNGVEVLVKDKSGDSKSEQTKYMEVKTIHPSVPAHMYASNFPKIDKRIDSAEDNNYELIQPSEVSHIPCTTTSCSCSHTKTESLKTKYTNIDMSSTANYGIKTSKYGTKIDLKPTNKDNNKTKYPYEFESTSQVAPIDKVVEKYTEVVNDYSDEKGPNTVEESELLTNEQAPNPIKINKITKVSEKKPEKPPKTNKNKFVVADLLKLGTLGIKGLTQLAPVIEKMTGSFIKRQDTVPEKTTTTIRPVEKLLAYNANKRVDSEIESKQSTFPIYIPVDEMETSESQAIYTNVTLHQNLAWAAEHKHPKSHIVPHKIIHESPLVNGGIPISPGEIITANSDVIVGKPAVGGPLTLAASGIKLHNPVNPPPTDSFVAANEQYYVRERPLGDQSYQDVKVDDSFDLRPPELPNLKPNRPLPNHRPMINKDSFSKYPYRMPNAPKDDEPKIIPVKSTNPVLVNHGRPAFLDYIPSLASATSNYVPYKHHVDFKIPKNSQKEEEIPDNSPSSSEIVNSHIRTEEEYTITGDPDANKPFLVDIQPSRVANVLIPHGSSTALVFAGSSEPHKTGDYIDDPLPYPEPGYFGSFSIDAPQMTNVHNVAPNNKPFINKPMGESPPENYKSTPSYKEHIYRNDLKLKWRDKRPIDINKLPPPTSNQETHLRVGPQITAYNPDIYNPSNGEFEKVKENDKQHKVKEVIDKDYENYLAVPPPPPKMLYSQDKPYNQKPIIQTKPIQDMKVFLNIQHPIPKEQLPPKVTSEIYFAAQAPNNKQTPTYTIHIPPATQPSYSYNNNNKQQTNNVNPPKINNGFSNVHNTFTIPSSNVANKSIVTQENGKDNTYTVTLNTATNVANNVKDNEQGIGSSVPVPIGSGTLNTNIPIGTNFAIRVEDNTPLESYNLQGNRSPPIVNDQHGHVPEVSIGDNRWNKSSIDANENTIIGHNHHDHIQRPVHVNVIRSTTVIPIEKERPRIPPSQNSHANFPMMHEHSHHEHPSSQNDDLRPVFEKHNDDVQSNDPKRPGKYIPNIPTNSHGWHSSVLGDQNYVKNIDIKIESTTRKVIPLIHDIEEKDKLPNFGQKITNAGKPPTEIWAQTKPSSANNYNIGKPFTRPLTHENQNIHFTNKPVDQNSYVISNFGAIKQPAYDIPIRDNSDETTTLKNIKPSTEKVKPVYETSEEIYDGGEEEEPETDGEVSSESMKIPVVSSSVEIEKPEKTSSEITLLQDEVIETSSTARPSLSSTESTTSQPKVEVNLGTQTEKPFGSFNKTMFQSNSMIPVYDSNPFSKPRPFTMGTTTVLDHQLQQPHWQINAMMENSTINVSDEDNFDLNIGEEMSSPSTAKLPSSTHKPRPHYNFGIENDVKYKNPFRPNYQTLNNTRANDSSIITSTVHIKDRKPLIVEKLPEKTTLPTLTTGNTFVVNKTSTEIIDLSPPPPTMDYNFKPSTNDEMIMGMSPPPPRNPPGLRQPPRVPLTPRPSLPARTPPTHGIKPPRTIPPRLPPQRPTRKPISRDEVSTYRPAYDLINNIRRPTYNRDQPSSQLLPPPRETSSYSESKPTTVSASNIIFPTPISSGWLTSSGIEFSSSFNFAPTSIQFPETTKPSQITANYDEPSSENSYANEKEYSSEQIENKFVGKPNTEDRLSDSKETNTAITSTEVNNDDSHAVDSSHEESTTDRMKITFNKNRTRKPYPFRHEEKKPSTTRFKLPVNPTQILRPTRTLTRPEVLYPTRHTSIKKIVRPIPTKSPAIIPSSVIESSETTIEEDFIKSTQVLKDFDIPTMSQIDFSNLHQVSAVPITPSLEDSITLVQATHHAGNEIKISDEVIPTKTEFKTTVVTLTKTLSEPPLTVSSIGYVNLTHTLTVTHTKTSLVSQSEGAVTQTLVLTNTHTSTIVDVVTEIHTQVQPTTIIETVTKHIPIPQVQPTIVQEVPHKTMIPLDDITMSSEEDNLIIRDSETTENVQKIDTDPEGDNDTFFVVMNKSQNGGQAPPINTEIETGDYDVTRNEQVNSNGVSQVLFGEILLAGTPYLETTHLNGGFGKECQPDCKASRNERCQRIDGLMKCVCRPGFARMFPDRPCKPTYTYSVKLVLGSQGNDSLIFQENLADNSSKQYQALAVATHEGINRMIMQSDLRDVYHGIHINGFQPIDMKYASGDKYKGVMNDFYVQLSDNAHESRLKEVIEKYLRTNNYSLGGTNVHAASELLNKLDVSDFDECKSAQFHDCSEHAQCFNLRGTYTCSCLEGYADLSVNTLYPGRICSAEPVGCERCNYHGSCYSRDDQRVLCECFQWYAGSACQVNLKVVLISLVVLGALLTVVLAICAVVACSKKRPRPPKRSIVACIQSMPSLHQGAMPSKQRADRRALINERETGDASSVQNASLPYMPAKRPSSNKKCIISDPPAHDPPPPPAPAVMIPRARLHAHQDSRENISRKRSLELSSEAKLISYLESGAISGNDEMRRKHSLESSYSANKDRHTKQGALVSAGFKVSTTVRPDDSNMQERDDLSSVNKNDLEAELRFDSLRKAYSQEELSEWTDAERRIGELTLSEARSVGGTLPASTGRAASSTRLTHQTSDVSEFDSL